MPGTRRNAVGIIVILSLLLLNSCALLGLDSPSEDDPYANDPVAQAALKLREQRSPASLGDSAPMTVNSLRSAAQAQDTPSPSSGQLTLHMSASEVRALWGYPQEVDTAGNPDLGNQRWTYIHGLSTQWGLSPYRVVYFEKGQVVGWENH